MKRTIIITAIVVGAAILSLIVFNRVAAAKRAMAFFAESLRGTFEITITASGELVPEKSIDIRGPVFTQTSDQGGQSGGGSGRGGPGGMQVRSLDIHAMDIKILDIVPEGTIVREGDYVAQLDKTNFENSLRDEFQNISTLQANLEIKILDTAMTMTSLRDQIKNQNYAVEEAIIELDQSRFEPPAVISKAKARLDREQRALEQLRKSYSLRAAQTLAEISTTKRNLERRQQLVKDLEEYIASFAIKAPADGMVTYKKDRGGNKRKAGSSLNPFDMVVATLPDLSVMISKIYVSEIEVSRIRTGQKAEIEIDAFPGKKYTGEIISIGNVGEQLPNSDAKMFETLIRLDGTDPFLRPAMTTGNKIVIKTFEDAIYIPTECIQAGPDSIPYVYLKNKTRHVILMGESNDKYTIVEQGIDPGASLYIIPPENPGEFRLVGKDLIPVIKNKIITKTKIQ